MNGGVLELAAVGKSIRSQREAAGLSQKALGDLVGLSRSSIAQIEAGKRKIDILLLRKLAQQLGVSPMHLLGKERNAKTLETTDEAIVREITKVSPGHGHSLGGFLEAMRNYKLLLNRSNKTRPRLPDPAAGFSTRSPKYRVSAEAIRVREILGLGDAPCGHGLREIIESFGVPVFLLDLDPDAISGLYVNYPGVGPTLMVNGRQLRWRQNFTLAHEFGHVWLHRSQRAVASRIFNPPAESREIETQANAFAAAILMPEKTIKQTLASIAVGEQIGVEEVIHLHRKMGVSYKAMLIRLKALRLINSKRYRQLSVQRPVSAAYRLGYRVDPSEVGSEAVIPLDEKFPREYLALVIDAWNKGELGEARAAEMLDTDIISLNEFMKCQHESAVEQQSEDLPDDIGG
jgi:Zn-dependent peptidase ImmA (M78 family)/transcriptional regulator with XRE-family HTH domain